MLSRIATRLQELFTFGAESKAQKRPSDSSNLNPSPSKRPKLIHKVTMENEDFDEELLRRPALSRSGEDVSRPPAGCDVSHPRLNSKSTTECRRDDGKVNGYDFSKSARNLTGETSFSFDSKDHTNTSARGRDSLGRPSLSDRSKVNQRSQNGNPTSPSIFKNWMGFTSSKADQILNPFEPQSNKKRSRTCQDAADRYLHKKVKPKELAIKQCFRIDEMKKYKEMLARYVSPTILDTVDLSKNNNSDTPTEVITISDTESTSERHRAKERISSPVRETSPITIGSAGTSPLSISDSIGKVPISMWHGSPRLESRTASISSTNTTRLNNLDHGGTWKTMEKKVERAYNLLDELSRPPAKNSFLERSDRIDLTQSRLLEEDVEIVCDRPCAKQRSQLNQPCTTGRHSISRLKKTSTHVDTIAIDDSDSESSSNDGDDNQIIRRNMQNANKTRQRFESQSTHENYARPGLRCLKDFEVSIQSSPYVKKDYLKNLLDKAEVGVRGLRVRETEAEIKEMRIMRQEREAQCNEKVTNLIRLTRRLPVPLEEKYIRVEEEEEEDDDVIIEEPPRDDRPELSDEQEEMVDRAFNCRNLSQVLAEGFRLQITARDISTLQGTNWLNDEVINFYFNMIVDRSQNNKKLPPVYAFNTFFYPKVMSGGQKAVRRWTKNVDIFEHTFVILPVHLGMHWCLAVIDFSRKEVRYYDSMGGKNNACLDALLNYLVDEMQDKKQKVFDCKGWQKINVQGIPQQMNGSDCGMFSCKFADYITKNSKITFNQSHMPYFRRRMVYEILTKKLM